LKDGRTHLAYKAEHAMDLDTGAVVTAEVHAADQGDTATMPVTLANAIEHLTAVDATPTPEAPAELIADKGYHSRDALKALDGGPWKSRISEPHRDGFSLWHGDDFGIRSLRKTAARAIVSSFCSWNHLSSSIGWFELCTSMTMSVIVSWI
jgi:transposase